MRPPNKLPFTQNKEQAVHDYVYEMARVLKKISFGDTTNTSDEQNIDGTYVSGTTDAVVGTEKVFAHTLGRIPSGYIVVRKDKNGVIYDGVTPFTSTNIYLKGSVASITFKILVF